MTQARIQINSVTGSNPPNGTAILVGSTVSVTNVNNGGESTYLWEFLDRPEGSSTTFINPNIQSTTFIPDVEGTYLIRLTVNRTLADERTDTQIAGCNTVRTGLRIPAAGETTQSSTSRGWALALNQILRKVDDIASDPGILVGYTTTGCNRGDIVKIGQADTLLSGLPDEVLVPRFVNCDATSATDSLLSLYIVEDDIDGNTAISANTIIRCRRFGLFGPLTGVPSVGDKVYMSDSGVVSLTAGTHVRQIGNAVHLDSGAYWINFDGVVNSSGVSSEAAFVLNASTTTGYPNAAALLALSTTLQLIGANSGIVPFKIRRYDSGTVVDFIRLANESGNTLFYIAYDGNLRWPNQGRISSNSGGLVFGYNGTDYWTLLDSGHIEGDNASQIKAVADPTDDQDAATKRYVDVTVGSSPTTVLTFGNSVAATTECYLDPGFGVRTAPVVGGAYPLFVSPVAGTIQLIKVRCAAKPTGAGQNVSLVVNGSPHATTGTLTAGVGSQTITITLTQAIAVGDTIAIDLKPGGVVLTGATEVTATVLMTG